MNYLSVQFALFLFAVVIGFHLCRPGGRALFLLGASYGFYALSSPVAAIGMLAATIFAFVLGPAIEPTQKSGSKEATASRPVMAFAVAVLVSYLSLFKVLRSIDLAKLRLPDWTVAAFGGSVLLPLGISYYVFKLISYIVDIYWGNIAPERNFVDFATYVAFFPQIVAGPIQRSGDFLQQIRKLSPTSEMMRRGLRRMLLGCFKKAVVADNLGTLIDLSYGPHAPAGAALLAFYLFPFQLYADFSALTDIAIGTALLFGIQSPENFNAPFLATNISQYWRRWHMTLTNWLGDYVFMPLRMATRAYGNYGLVFSLMVNMILIGLWHNLSWCFLVFGVLHGIFLSVDALTARGRSKFFKSRPAWDRAGNCVGPVFTFHLVALAMVFVRAVSLSEALHVLSSLPASAAHVVGLILGSNEAEYGLAGLALWAAFEFVWRQDRFRAPATPMWFRWAFYYTVIAIIVKFGHNAKGFIYFKF